MSGQLTAAVGKGSALCMSFSLRSLPGKKEAGRLVTVIKNVRQGFDETLPVLFDFVPR